MKSTIELIRLLFIDAQLVDKTEEKETYRYSEESYILELDISKEQSEARIILRDEVVHREEFETKKLLGMLPYLRGLAMGKVIEGAMEVVNEGVGLTGI